MKLDLGCSFHKLPGYIGVDILKVQGVDVIADGCSLPFRESVFDGIYASHCIEHIADQLAVIKEMWRVSRPGTEIHMQMPHFSNPSYFDDLTHQRLYSTRSFEHFDHDLHELTGHPNYLPDVNLKLTYQKLVFWPERIMLKKSFLKGLLIKISNNILNFLANINPFLCERIWCRWVGGFYEVEFKLLVKK